MNWGPLSLRIDFGGPNVVIHRSIALMMDIALISSTGTNIQYLLNLSIMVTMYWQPDFALQIGLENGYLIICSDHIFFHVFLTDNDVPSDLQPSVFKNI